MPLFITDEELESLRFNDSNVTLIVSRADSFITNLQRQLETVKAQSEASSITAEQTCSLVEQKYISLSSDIEKLESQNAELNAAIERNLEELAIVKSENHRIHLESIEKDGTIERLWAEVSEFHKSKRQLLGIIVQQVTEITEKNTTIKSYLDKIVNLTEAAALKESQLHEREAEFVRLEVTCARLSQGVVGGDGPSTSMTTVLESALKASETAQAQLHSERVKSRELLFSDEEFKALQIQVRELNLLRESNLQLREENKHNFEECQRLRELAQKASAEMDHLETMVEEKKIEVDSCRKEIEILGVEKGNLEIRIAEAETEISLLRQEKLRLQSQDTAVRCLCSRHSTCATIACDCCAKKVFCTPSCDCRSVCCSRRYL